MPLDNVPYLLKYSGFTLYLLSIYECYLGLTQDVPRTMLIYPKFTQDLSRTYPGFTQDLPRIYAANTPA